jgi:hypothetical protein
MKMSRKEVNAPLQLKHRQHLSRGAETIALIVTRRDKTPERTSFCDWKVAWLSHRWNEARMEEVREIKQVPGYIQIYLIKN